MKLFFFIKPDQVRFLQKHERLVDHVSKINIFALNTEQGLLGYGSFGLFHTLDQLEMNENQNKVRYAFDALLCKRTPACIF